jgi:hypothetical protein
VNDVKPGPIDTDMNPASNGEFAEAQKVATALGRYGKPEEVAVSGRLPGQTRSGLNAECRRRLPRLDAGLQPSLLELMSMAPVTQIAIALLSAYPLLPQHRLPLILSDSA